MDWNDAIWENIFNEVISNMQPDCVPLEFVISAQFRDHFGVNHILHDGNDLMLFMMNPQRFYVQEALVILDVAGLRRAMGTKVSNFLGTLDPVAAKHSSPGG